MDLEADEILFGNLGQQGSDNIQIWLSEAIKGKIKSFINDKNIKDEFGIPLFLQEGEKVDKRVWKYLQDDQ